MKVQLKMTRPDWHLTTLLSTRSSYDNENQAHSSRVMDIPDVADNSLRVASEKQHGAASNNTWNFPNIAPSEFYFWHIRTKRARSTKLRMHSERDPHCQWRVTPTSGIVDYWSLTWVCQFPISPKDSYNLWCCSCCPILAFSCTATVR